MIILQLVTQPLISATCLIFQGGAVWGGTRNAAFKDLQVAEAKFQQWPWFPLRQKPPDVMMHVMYKSGHILWRSTYIYIYVYIYILYKSCIQWSTCLKDLPGISNIQQRPVRSEWSASDHILSLLVATANDTQMLSARLRILYSVWSPNQRHSHWSSQGHKSLYTCSHYDPEKKFVKLMNKASVPELQYFLYLFMWYYLCSWVHSSLFCI